MQRMSAREAKNGFGKLIDLARAEPVAIEKCGRSVVIVMAVEECEAPVRQDREATLRGSARKGQRGEDVMTMNRAAATNTRKAA